MKFKNKLLELLLQGFYYYLNCFRLDNESCFQSKINIFEYPLLGRLKAVKVIVHFKEDGPILQKIIEELLLECCCIN